MKLYDDSQTYSLKINIKYHLLPVSTVEEQHKPMNEVSMVTPTG